MSIKHESNPSLADLGWQQFFVQQLSLDDWDNLLPARIIEQHKSELIIASEVGYQAIQAPQHLADPLTVGDWILITAEQKVERVLERKSIFYRKAAGTKIQKQLIGANVDTLIIVSSLNHDFNLNRIERYLVLANEAGVDPVIVLTKADLCDNEDEVLDRVNQVQRLDSMLMVYAINALDEHGIELLSQFCKPGQTLALLGSSGVGKSTLTNALLGQTIQLTSDIREDDSKGRHTTTGRSLHVIKPHGVFKGGVLLDTPGMRELQLANVESGIEETFSDIADLAMQCRFSNCTHEMDLPDSSGCAVQAAVKDGRLDERRLLNFHKLQREDARNSATLAEQRDQDKQFGKMVRTVMNEKKKRKGH